VTHELAFEYLHHLVTVPVRVGDTETRFVVDSGIGVSIVRQRVAEAAGVRANGASFTGRRMSGQEVRLPLGVAPALVVGALARTEVEVGLLELELPAEFDGVGGFLSLAFFDDAPFTIDYPGRALVLEDSHSMAVRREHGVVVALEVFRDGPSVDAFTRLTLPGGREVRVEVDMGSDALILDERFAAEAGVALDGPDVRCVEDVDETGRRYTRTFAKLGGSIHLAGAPELVQEHPDVIFQQIVHDGLLGDAFLRRYVVSWDVAGAALVLRRP
jgi:Aspartyl protease